MNFFIVGDVHGCFFSFRKLLESWDPATEHLIQVGDLIDRGNFNPEVINLAMGLDEGYENTTFLLGNHEYMCLDFYQGGIGNHWRDFGGRETEEQFEKSTVDFGLAREWMGQLPLKYEAENLLVTHAGFATHNNPYKPENPFGVLWNRQFPYNVGKLQVFGHTPQASGRPVFNDELNFANIDTGCVYQGLLTGLRVSESGERTEVVQVKVDPKDSNYAGKLR